MSSATDGSKADYPLKNARFVHIHEYKIEKPKRTFYPVKRLAHGVAGE
jgi:hypothetical protein